MVEVLVLILCAWICVVDVKSHRIPNELSFLLAGVLLFDSVTAQLFCALIASVSCLLIAYAGKVGAGDVKLFLVLIATSGSLVLTQGYFLGMAFASLLALVASLFTSHLKGREAPRSIAFAPSILIPFLLLYLAI